MEGWIKIYRKMLEWEWYNDNNTKILFLHLLLTANHKEKKWKGQIIKRGQKITSLQHLAEETRLSVRQVRTSLDKLKSTHEITIKTTNKNTLVTIEKYNDYQDKDNNDDKQNDKQFDNEMTIKRQTNDKQMTTNKNEKNDKNEKNERIDVAVEEITKCYEENIGLITPATAELLFSYLDTMEYQLIIKAIKIATVNNKRTGRYIQGILNDWNRKGIKTVLDAENEQNQFNRKEQQEETEEEKKKRKIKELEESIKDEW